MHLTREDLFPLFNFRPGLDKFFEDFVEAKAPALPPLNVRETPDAILVEVELPGLKPSEIEVRVENGMLHLSVGRKQERLLALSDRVEGQNVEATFKEGVLRVTLPRKRIVSVTSPR